ncbi:N-6 DNA methylase [Patescibacteria group bacterium]|nr:N-6 DNA methylase [Patescibacteria group bacterium]MBU4512773.1 N-6 DNA methylase [Patescibacteria group bacterium]MCG2693112.1 N-6 DNA methylase [Candidatus Parcubacteria bacterium]
MTKGIKQKKQDLGIFYTDQRITDFVFDILKIWKEKEEKETGRWESRKHFPSVIDPAVGEGVFLKKAIESQFTIPTYIWGVDIDDEVKKRWGKINLLRSFGSKADLDFHFYHQNGLLPLPEKKMLHKKGGLREFDAVVGNPPYGGIGLGETKLSDDLILNLSKYEVLPEKIRNYLIGADRQGSFLSSTEKANKVSSEVKLRLKSFPIEVLFIDRFIQLAKPGGWIAIIIPDGILTNSNSHYVREFISEKAKVEAIVSLPRDAFKNVGTSAKTSILFLQKYKDQEKKQKDYPVFLASVDSLDEKNFNLVKDNYKNYYNKTMNKKNLVQITTDEKGREILMVRVDKTLKEMMDACKSPNLEWSRFDVKFWHSKYEDIIKIMSAHNNLKGFGDFISFFKQGDIPRAARGEKGEGITVNKNNRLLEGTSMNDTGFDLEQYQVVSDKFWQRMKDARIHKDDLIFTRTGASLGQSVVITEEPKRVYLINGALDIIRFNKDINPFYAVVFLMSEFGRMQIERIENGVGQPNLSEDELYQILIPDMPVLIQKNIESEYKKMSKYHDKAMWAKKDNNETEYKRNIETAEKMLRDLIAKTEAVIRGERKDAI